MNATQKQKRKNSSYYEDSDAESEEGSSRSDSEEEEAVENHRAQKTRLVKLQNVFVHFCLLACVYMRRYS